MIALNNFAKLLTWLGSLLVLGRLPLAVGVQSWQRWGSSKGTLSFSKPGGELLQRGKDQVEALHTKAKEEGFLDIMLGTNCYTVAVGSLEVGCQAMDADASMWLAFHLANCLWAKTGRRTYSGDECTQPGHDAASCISQMTGEDYIVFIQFLQNVHTMCMFIANADFQERAEAMLNKLFRGGAEASLQVAHLQEGLDQQSSKLLQINGDLHLLASEQQHLSDGLRASSDMLEGLQSTAAHLSEGMQRSEAAHHRLLQAEEAVAAGLAQMRQAQVRHVQDSQAAWMAAEEQAQRVIEWQEQYAQLQDQILTSTVALTKASDGVELAMHLFESAQQRGNNALAMVLGSSYKLTDFMFYGSGLIILVVAGWNAQLQRSRLPVFVLYLFCIVTERSMLAWLSPQLKLGLFDQPVLQLPSPLQFFVGVVSVDRIKSCIRAGFAVTILAVLMRSLWSQHHPEEAWARLLQYLMDLEERQSNLWINMEGRILAALRQMRCNRSSSHDGGAELDISAQEHAREHQILDHVRHEAAQTRHVPHCLGMPIPVVQSHAFPDVKHQGHHETAAGCSRGARVRRHVESSDGVAVHKDASFTAHLRHDKKYMSSAKQPAPPTPPGSGRFRGTNQKNLTPEHVRLRRSERISGSQQRSGSRSTSQPQPGQPATPCCNGSQLSGAASGSQNPSVEKEGVRNKRGVDGSLRAAQTKRKRLR